MSGGTPDTARETRALPGTTLCLIVFRAVAGGPPDTTRGPRVLPGPRVSGHSNSEACVLLFGLELDVDHEVGRDFFEATAQGRDGEVGRKQHGGAGLKKHAAVHRCADAFGGEFLDVDVLRGKRAGNLEEDAGAVLTDE